MIGFPGAFKIYLALEPVDLRKSFEGLSCLTVQVLKESPEEGGLFVFTNRRKNRIKILHYDDSGQWVLTKRLEQGTFSWPKGVGTGKEKLFLNSEALTLLMDGVDLRGGKLRPWYQRG
jgi:transposase